MDVKRQCVAVLGAHGLLGRGLCKLLGETHTIFPLSREKADVTRPESLRQALAEAAPDVVVNCSGLLNVDRCQREPQQSYLVNGEGAIHIAQVIGEMEPARRPVLIHFSSDFVFDGVQGSYREEDPARPLSYYGTHKLIADEFLLHSGLRDFYILRMASVVCCVEERDNFVKRMIALAYQKPYLQIVDDLQISLTTIEVLAWYVDRFLHVRPPSGLYNAVCAGTTTWYDILATSFQDLGIDREVRPVSIEAMPNANLRPRKSDLEISKAARALNASVPEWKAALQEHLDKNAALYEAVKAHVAG
jgi:dTDP-4-dehydrorhamnose reductase